MTVQELIETLRDLPPTAPVMYYGSFGGGDTTEDEVATVHVRIDADTHETSIWLE